MNIKQIFEEIAESDGALCRYRRTDRGAREARSTKWLNGKKRAEHRKDECADAADPGRLEPGPTPLVDEVARDDLEQRDRGGQRRETDEHVEQRCEHAAERHLLVEQGGQRDEEHPCGGRAHRFVHLEGKDHREHDDRGA